VPAGYVGSGEGGGIAGRASPPLGINGLAYELDLRISKDEIVTQSLEVPPSRYEQKSDLLFPLRGRFMVIRGAKFNEPQKLKWSQKHQLIIAGLGGQHELLPSRFDNLVLVRVGVLAPMIHAGG